MHVTPYLCVHDAAAALAFYRDAFGANEPGSRILDDQGRVGHAEFWLGETRCYLSDEHPEIDVRAPNSIGGSAVSFTLEVADVDRTFEQAMAAGATCLAQPEDQFYGARVGQVLDPFGFRWSLSTTQVTLSDDELAKRVEGQFTLSKPD